LGVFAIGGEFIYFALEGKFDLFIMKDWISFVKEIWRPI
jgi:hypothetical protein